VRQTEVGTPVASSHGDDAQLGDDDGRTDGGSDFLRCLDAQTNMALRIANDDNGLESRSLTGTSLLLNRLDLYSEEVKKVSNSVQLSHSNPFSLSPPTMEFFSRKP
jgi:hypothetical protein